MDEIELIKAIASYVQTEAEESDASTDDIMCFLIGEVKRELGEL